MAKRTDEPGDDPSVDEKDPAAAEAVATTEMAQGPDRGEDRSAPGGPPEATGAAGRLRRLGFFLLRALAILAAFAAMVAFAAVLARLTLTPVPGAAGHTHTNLEPGWSLRFYLDAPARDAIQQVGGNIVLGAPFGILLPILYPGFRRVVRTVVLTATVMLLVETVQGTLITGRAFDIDDVILNTTGALLGYVLLGRRISRAVHGWGRR
ncbi:VanZ family protein [Streptomonospora litoralis]|uniref:VanZ like family protein n=1 Tax=Streptomonospora litoralis TaxID=2498135 RepID=A0A4P6QAC8_9ACTN|nr:VanZ family protein [Streptomonospora litoralis]QBI56374.1 VanZ like family protein [Streptomonospora litoralis]